MSELIYLSAYNYTGGYNELSSAAVLIWPRFEVKFLVIWKDFLVMLRKECSKTWFASIRIQIKSIFLHPDFTKAQSWQRKVIEFR
jgi:hypothetical protein